MYTLARKKDFLFSVSVSVNVVSYRMSWTALASKPSYPCKVLVLPEPEGPLKIKVAVCPYLKFEIKGCTSFE